MEHAPSRDVTPARAPRSVGGPRRLPFASLRTGTPTVQASLPARLRATGSRLVVGAAIIALVFVVVLVGFRLVYGGRVYPAISVAGVSVGGMKHDSAAEALDARVGDLNHHSVAFTFNGQTLTPSLSDLGVSIDTNRSLDEAFGYGREDQAVQRLQVARQLLRGDHQVPLYATLDQSQLNAWFDATDRQIGLVPHDAYLSIQGTEVSVVPEVEGTVVDRAAATQQIMSAVTSLTPVNGALPVRARVPRVRAADLDTVKAQAQAALAKSVEVRLDTQSWTLKPEDLAPFLVQGNDPAQTGAAAASLRVDTGALSQWLSTTFAAQVYAKPTNAVLGWNNGPVALQASVDGRALKPETFAGLVAESMLGQHERVDVPTDPIKAQVNSSNLASLDLTTKLGHGDSTYVGSDWGRATNIGVGTNLLNGTLVAPGANFSFNHAIGAITPEKGYVPAHVIKAEAIGQDYGGGICQVSTTMFRAALMAGMPITDWTPHSQRISFYEPDGWGPGYDATIFQPADDPMSGTDFGFSNPTNGWLLIEAIADGSYISINIYGPDTGWQVNVSDAVRSDPIPPAGDSEVVDGTLSSGCVVQTQSPLDGLDVSFERQVLDKNGSVISDRTFNTHFLANGNVWVVSPDMVGQSPASGGSDWGNCTFSSFNT